MQKEKKVYIYITDMVVSITEKKSSFTRIRTHQVDTYIDCTYFPIKAWFNFKCFQVYAFMAWEIKFWNLWPA